MKNTSKCYLCKSIDILECPGSVRDNKELKILECNDCGLVFISSFEHIKEAFYEDSSMHEKCALEVETWLKETDWDDERRFQFLKSLIVNKTVLDFGCGPGGFILKARKLAKFIHGVELERRLYNHYKTNNLKVVQDLSELSDNETYNVITLFQVLEHISDPISKLIQIKSLLSKNGQIIIEVPNADDALLTLYGNEPFSHFTYWSCHLFLFTAMTLGMIAKKAGLKINYIRQVQRYSLSNHLHWLAKGKPGGHQKWHFLDTPELHRQYGEQLGAIGKCDTLIGSFSNK